MTDRRPMTTRELFRRIMRFEKPDRTPLWQVEGIADRATLRWQAEGSLKPDQSPYEVIPFDDLLMPDMRLEDILYCAELIRRHVP